MKNAIAYLKKVKSQLPTVLGNEAVNFFQDNIKQGVDSNGKAFKPRAGNFSKNTGRTVLTQRGTLRRSIRVMNKAQNSVKIGSTVPYAQIHNEGGKIKITEKMRSFFWAKYFEAEKKAGKFSESAKDSQIRRYKKANQEVMFWKSMLSKSKTHVNIPQRQFAGGGARLFKRLQTAIDKIP